MIRGQHRGRDPMETGQLRSPIAFPSATAQGPRSPPNGPQSFKQADLARHHRRQNQRQVATGGTSASALCPKREKLHVAPSNHAHPKRASGICQQCRPKPRPPKSDTAQRARPIARGSDRHSGRGQSRSGHKGGHRHRAPPERRCRHLKASPADPVQSRGRVGDAGLCAILWDVHRPMRTCGLPWRSVAVQTTPKPASS